MYPKVDKIFELNRQLAANLSHFTTPNKSRDGKKVFRGTNDYNVPNF